MQFHLLAAGSLVDALGTLSPLDGHTVAARFGPSGLLRAEIEAGAAWDVFVSADEGHPARLAAAGLSVPPRRLCTNAMCLIVRPDFAGAAARELLRRDGPRLGISTPGNDPAGDWALAVFRRAEALEAGLGDALERRALRVAGAPGLPPAPEGRNRYRWLLDTGAVDVVLTYRTNAIAARADGPPENAPAIVELSEALVVETVCGIARRADSGPEAEAFVAHLLGPQVEARLAALGFGPASKEG